MWGMVAIYPSHQKNMLKNSRGCIPKMKPKKNLANPIWPKTKDDIWPESEIQIYIVTKSLQAGYVVHGDGAGIHKGKRGGGMAKLQGQRKGWPDLAYVTRRGMVYVELKRIGGRLSAEQVELHNWMRECGVPVYVVYARDGVDGWNQVAGILNG